MTGPIDVLIVEDNRWVAESLRRAIEGDPAAPRWRARRAAGLAEGRRMVVDRAPNCVLVDLTLPDGDGAELVEFVRAARPGARVFVLSGRPDAAARGARADADATYVKGDFELDDLLAALPPPRPAGGGTP